MIMQNNLYFFNCNSDIFKCKSNSNINDKNPFSVKQQFFVEKLKQKCFYVYKNVESFRIIYKRF